MMDTKLHDSAASSVDEGEGANGNGSGGGGSKGGGGGGGEGGSGGGATCAPNEVVHVFTQR